MDSAHGGRRQTATATLRLRDLGGVCCAGAAERALPASPHVIDVRVSYGAETATVTKMKQNLFWASIYNVLAIPVAAGALYPAYGIMLRPEWSALLMSLSSIVVAVNAVSLKRVEGDLERP